MTYSYLKGRKFDCLNKVKESIFLSSFIMNLTNDISVGEIENITIKFKCLVL